VRSLDIVPDLVFANTRAFDLILLFFIQLGDFPIASSKFSFESALFVINTLN
jgi:hypothetical protein